MFAYVCIHDAEAYLRQAMKAGVQRSCHVKVGPGLALGADREVHPVVAVSEEALYCWLSELNAECAARCTHVVGKPNDTQECGEFAFARHRVGNEVGTDVPGKEDPMADAPKKGTTPAQRPVKSRPAPGCGC